MYVSPLQGEGRGFETLSAHHEKSSSSSKEGTNLSTRVRATVPLRPDRTEGEASNHPPRLQSEPVPQRLHDPRCQRFRATGAVTGPFIAGRSMPFLQRLTYCAIDRPVRRSARMADEYARPRHPTGNKRDSGGHGALRVPATGRSRLRGVESERNDHRRASHHHYVMSNYFLAGVLVGLLIGGVLGSLAMCLVVVGSKGRSYSAREATPPITGVGPS
jgi:hypothetical protein